MKFDLKYNRLIASYRPGEYTLAIGNINSRPYAKIRPQLAKDRERSMGFFFDLLSPEEKIAFRAFTSVLTIAERDTKDIEVWVGGNSEKTDLRTWNYVKGTQVFFEAVDCTVVIYDAEAQAFFHKLDHSTTVCHGVGGCGCDGTGPCPENWRID